MPEDNSTIQKFLRSEISFYSTVIIAVFTVAAMFFGLQNRIDLLNQRLEFLVAQSSDVAAKSNALELRIVALEKEIALLKAK